MMPLSTLEPKMGFPDFKRNAFLKCNLQYRYHALFREYPGPWQVMYKEQQPRRAASELREVLSQR
jgi:hypothetical protein